MSDKLTALEAGVALIYSTFVQYAAGEEGGDPETISNKEFSKMMAEQMPCLAGNCEAEKAMAALDADKDGTLNFLEYCTMVTSMAMVLHSVASEKK